MSMHDLLGLVQTEFPLEPRPFASLAHRLGCSEADVLTAVERLRADGVIREISGLFDPTALGYDRALCAFAVPPERLDAAGQQVAMHPGVSHCYGREHAVNLWFTLAVSPESRLGLSRTVDLLKRFCNASAAMVLPTVRQYKLDVPGAIRLFHETDDKSRDVVAPGSAAKRKSLSDIAQGRELSRIVSAIRALQQDLPTLAEPFDALAAGSEDSTDDLLAMAKSFLARGWMRRYGAGVRHRRAGASENVLVAWQIEPNYADAAGAACSAERAVSHCYLRPPADGWPYTLYTMVHGRSRKDCSQVIDRLALSAGLGVRQELWTTAEFVKRRIVLFDLAERRWEEHALGADQGVYR